MEREQNFLSIFFFKFIIVFKVVAFMPVNYASHTKYGQTSIATIEASIQMQGFSTIQYNNQRPKTVHSIHLQYQAHKIRDCNLPYGANIIIQTTNNTMAIHPYMRCYS